MRRFVLFAGTALTVALVTAGAYGQGARGAVPQPLPTAKARAPFDMTGYWVSMVTEDWRFRMITPPKGDYLGVPLNQEARSIADRWDPAKDEAAGEQCKAYGAANLMRVPGRLHVTWQDDNTLKIEAEAGNQTRLLHFGGQSSNAATWQGDSAAEWEFAGG